MRSVTITLLAKDGFSKVIDVCEEILRYGIFNVSSGSGKRQFVQDREHMTLFKER